MDKKRLIDSYLEGKHPIEQEKWELPSESELDRDEALFDALLADPPQPSLKGREKASPLSGSRIGSWERYGKWLLAAAAVVVAVLTSLTWKSFMPNPQQQLVAEENTTRREVNHDTSKSQARHVEIADTTRQVEEHSTVELQTPHAEIANAARGNGQRRTRRLEAPKPKTAEEPQPSTETVVLTNAADSLYYYLTQLENQMGDCRDSTCLAELTGLMRADERIKDLVNKIIHKQVETAYQEEYLVDTTTRYIPL